MNSHSGNHRFRTIAKEYQQEYRARKTNIEKRDIVLQILACINDSGGHFLQSNNNTAPAHSTWSKLSPPKIVRKISQFLGRLKPLMTAATATVVVTAMTTAATTTGMMPATTVTATAATTTTATTTTATTTTAALTATTEQVNELCDVFRVISTEEEKVECRNYGCTDQAVATWSSNVDPEDKWDLCEKCQLEEFGG